ncbi:hypothetical protein TI39_contig598g00018 [Zymoseptoria brevis]|uniref:C2H2-type domain-containing protein n=1 Tax=Zymoseptoria brevis TaxID=1047168 RepID=A0A0F4GHR8_9PEZI|nr:hypothetical protein TI39_contig598g00018 [Zymoseptoria brevis]
MDAAATKRKLPAEESTPVKKARHQPSTEIDDNSSASSTPSLADTATATATAFTTTSTTTRREKKFVCPYEGCNSAYDRPVRLKGHINTHTGERPFACNEPGCGKTFCKPEHLLRHVDQNHGGEIFTCTRKIGPDETCGKKFTSSYRLRRHEARHQEKDETTCTWEGCNKVFRKQDTLQRHIRKDHLGEDSYVCDHDMGNGETCGQSFATPGLLKGHTQREHAAPKYWCDICTNAANPEVEEIIAPIHNDLDPEFLPTAEDLMEIPEGVNADLMRNLSVEDNAPRVVRLPAGLVSFPTLHDLQRHNKAVHPPICTECGKKCRSGKDLRAHIDIEHPPSGIRVEMPPPEKKFVCPYDGCIRSIIGNGFTKKGNVAAHVKSMHKKEKNFICGEFDLSDNDKVAGWHGDGCGQKLSSKQGLIAHVRTQHLCIQAAVGKRTGLKDEDRKRPIRRTKSAMTDSDNIFKPEEMDVDYEQTPAVPDLTMAMLTGSGYEHFRPIACLEQGCQVRFARQQLLEKHLELSHGWQIEDIEDAMSRSEGMGDQAEEILRRELQEGMAGIVNVDPRLQGAGVAV